MGRIIFAFPLLAAIVSDFVSAAEIPPVPAKDGVGYFIQDYAGLIDDSTRQRIGDEQKTAFERDDTPIIVVTISRMSKYGHNGSIETLATEWFNAWRIGTTDRDDGANKGILVLVSVGDRKARIELGGDWGRGWDNHCQTIMQTQIIPYFKQDDYAEGIASGVSALKAMAEAGPSGTPPAVSLPDRVRNVSSKGSRGLGGCGSCLSAPLLLIMGLLSAIFGKGGGSSSGGFSGGFSGGGFSGGSSGGGGATGSW